MTEYIAGSCNIGSAEIHRRFRVAIIGFILYLAMAIYFIATDATQSARLIVFLPAMMASVGFIQARRKFCLAYGLMGVFNFGSQSDISKIKDPVALAADRAYAIKILGIAIIPTLALTALAIVI